MSKQEHYFVDAESLYIKGKTLSEIEKMLGISRRTLTKWKKKGNWEEKRKQYLKNPQVLSEILLNALTEKAKSLGPNISAKDADEISKIAAVYRNLGLVTPLSSQVIFVMERFMDFIKKETERELQEKITKLIAKFFNKIKEEEYGKQ
jgi:transcriptional regulator with XRE-family HTH domain